jgi:hypothetical protein
MAIEITAAGIDEAKVRPTFRPRYTLAAVKIVVMSAPRIRPRMVSSFGFVVIATARVQVAVETREIAA